MKPMAATGTAVRRATVLLTIALPLIGLLAGAGLYLHFHRFVPPQDRAPSAYRPPPPVPDDLSWTAYGGDPGQTRHSAIRQIDRSNVAHLRQAWIYRTGELARRGGWAREGKFQNTPIIAAGNLVVCTPFNRAIALDPVSGSERWVYEPQVAVTERPNERFNCRGLARWSQAPEAGDPSGSGGEAAAAPAAAAATGSTPACAERLFMATTDRRIIALDARTGLPCRDFGTAGEVRIEMERPELREAELQFASAPAVVGDVLVVGSASGDNGRAFGPAGVVRAFDARTGAQRWSFDPIPRVADPVASPTWQDDSAARTGQANVWGSITVDVARDLVFLPTSSPSPDFFGGLRKGDNLYANSMVALRGSTGEIAWHFQTVHHDLWDYDVPAGPSLFDFRPHGSAPDAPALPALVFATKTGFLFVLHRETGQPLTAVEERAAPASDVPGEWTAATQPWSVGLPALSPHGVTADDAFGLLVMDRIACREAIAQSRNDGLFTPPATGGGTLLAPMGAGGANWGGVAIDKARNRVFVNTNNAIHRVTLLPADEAARRRAQERGQSGKEISLMRGTPYGMVREVVLSPLGLPCNKPPWGKLAAVDLDSGRLAWEVTLGNTRKLAPLGLSLDLGTPNLGGPITTDGGLLFIGATLDNLLRAFDVDTGKALWAGELPNGGQATPMTYAVGGRQYVVIVAGGHPVFGNEIGESVVAFALPER
jgi:quinoprotein glucose dehydrogenase